MKKFIFVFLPVLVCFIANAQDELLVEHSCNFYHKKINKTFNISEPSPEAEKLIEKVLKGVDLYRNFTLKAADCEDVLATIEGKQRFLLYNPAILKDVEKDGIAKWIVYIKIAHAIGHHLNNHDFESVPEFNERLEIEEQADKFAGFALCELVGMFGNPSEVINAHENLIAKIELNSFLYMRRRYVRIRTYGFRESFEKCYEKKLVEKMKEPPDYSNGNVENNDDHSPKVLNPFEYGDDPSMINFLKSKFPYPPPDCNSELKLYDHFFSNSMYLGDVARKISFALSGRGYPHRFLSFPNGYVIVTQMEQYNADGTIIEDDETRWVHYPKQEEFSWSIDYFSSLIFPKKCYLRVFVFIVSADNYKFEGQASKSEATKWHSQGVTELPDQIASLPYSASQYDVRLLTYEFEVPESNHKAQQKCPCCKLSAENHLELSQIYYGLFIH